MGGGVCLNLFVIFAILCSFCGSTAQSLDEFGAPLMDIMDVYLATDTTDEDTNTTTTITTPTSTTSIISSDTPTTTTTVTTTITPASTASTTTVTTETVPNTSPSTSSPSATTSIDVTDDEVVSTATTTSSTTVGITTTTTSPSTTSTADENETTISRDATTRAGLVTTTVTSPAVEEASTPSQSTIETSSAPLVPTTMPSRVTAGTTTATAESTMSAASIAEGTTSVAASPTTADSTTNTPSAATPATTTIVSTTSETSPIINTTTSVTTVATIAPSSPSTISVSSSATTPPHTTASPPSTLPPPVPIEANWTGSFYAWNLTFVLETPYYLIDMNTMEYKDMVKTQLDVCYRTNETYAVSIGYAGIGQYIEIGSSIITSFSLSLYAIDNETLIRYSAVFKAESILINGTLALIDEYISGPVMASLRTSTFNGSNTNDTYINTTCLAEITNESMAINSSTANFCASAPPDCPYGHNCVSLNPNLPCYPVCYESNSGTNCCTNYTDPNNERCEVDHEICYVVTNPGSDSYTYKCSCDNSYSDVSGSCYDTALVIVVSVLLALVVITTCVGVVFYLYRRKNPKTRNNHGYLLDDVWTSDGAYAMKGYSDNSKKNDYDTVTPVQFSNETYGNPLDAPAKTGSYRASHNAARDSSSGRSLSSSDDGSDSIANIALEHLQQSTSHDLQTNLDADDAAVDYFYNRSTDESDTGARPREISRL